LHALRLDIFMAKEGEVAFWFQPLQMPSHCVLGASSRPSGRGRDRGLYLAGRKSWDVEVAARLFT